MVSKTIDRGSSPRGPAVCIFPIIVYNRLNMLGEKEYYKGENGEPLSQEFIDEVVKAYKKTLGLPEEDNSIGTS